MSVSGTGQALPFLTKPPLGGSCGVQGWGSLAGGRPVGRAQPLLPWRDRGDRRGLAANTSAGSVLGGHPLPPLHRNGTHSMGRPCGCPGFRFRSVFAHPSALKTGTGQPGQPQLQLLEFAQATLPIL